MKETNLNDNVNNNENPQENKGIEIKPIKEKKSNSWRIFRSFRFNTSYICSIHIYFPANETIFIIITYHRYILYNNYYYDILGLYNSDESASRLHPSILGLLYRGR
jgi:hypothetical protein